MKQKECLHWYSMQEAKFSSDSISSCTVGVINKGSYPVFVFLPQVNWLVTNILYLLLFRLSSFHIKWTDSLPMFKIDYIF
ncbi:hypothetical protein CN474_25630 [Bacillus thuringiensis]|nr:hypothetical protein CN474_25630 [Bacillus thuringiensis]PGM52281.1 hypothetical protein CN949_10800 [Bacillus thuringiensis]